LALQRIDRHPIGEVDGAEVEGFSEAELNCLLEHQILVQRTPLEELDGCPVQWLGGKPYLFDLEGQRPAEEIDPRLLTTYDIDVKALCHALRRATELSGRPIELLSDVAYVIGAHGSGSRRRFICLVRLLCDETATEIVCILRARLGAESLVVLTPRKVELQHRTRQHLAEERILILPLFDAIDQTASHPFVLQSAALTQAIPSARSAGRLQIVAAGHSAVLDGVEVNLSRGEFAEFLALAEEAGQKNGYVPTEGLLQVIDAFRNDPEEPATPENLDNVLSGIRRALTDAAGIPASEMKLLVETRRNLGHRLGLKKLGLGPSDIAIV
jgi:hypothetical protein